MNPKIESLIKIKNDLKFCNDFDVVLYGSFLTDSYIENRSDIDVAVITHKSDKSCNLDIWKSLIENTLPPYDIRVFELFPLHVKINIVNCYYVVYGNDLDISEYFYSFRREWKEMENRILENQFKSIDEQLAGIERRKKVIKVIKS